MLNVVCVNVYVFVITHICTAFVRRQGRGPAELNAAPKAPNVLFPQGQLRAQPACASVSPPVACLMGLREGSAVLTCKHPTGRAFLLFSCCPSS